MKFSFTEFHLWHQLGLSLMAAGKVSSFLLIYGRENLTHPPSGSSHMTVSTCAAEIKVMEGNSHQARLNLSLLLISVHMCVHARLWQEH